MKYYILATLSLIVGSVYAESTRQIVLYDFGMDPPVKILIFPVIALAMMIIVSIGISTDKRITNKSVIKFLIFFDIVWVLVVSAILVFNVTTYLKLKRIYEDKSYHIVEGLVKNFKIIDTAHSYEGFEVNGIPFEVADTNPFDFGFHKQGQIRDGLPVKIFYCEGKNSKGIILHLEIDWGYPN